MNKNNPKYIVIHCTDVSHTLIKDQYNSVNKYHKSIDFPQSRSGSFVGYHSLITGGKEYICKEDDEEGAHCNNVVNGVSVNLQSLGVCIGFDGDIEYPTGEDFRLFKLRVLRWQEKYNIPDIDVRFHRDFNTSKTCAGSLLGQDWIKALLKKETVPMPPSVTPSIKPLEQCLKQEAIIKMQGGILRQILDILLSWSKMS